MSGARPLVAVVCRVPVIGEAIGASLASVADVQTFPARRGETLGLLRWLRPDGVVVDSDEDAEEAHEFARTDELPVVHVSLRERKLRLLRGSRWEDADADASPEGVRNVLLAGIFGRRPSG